MLLQYCLFCNWISFQKPSVSTISYAGGIRWSGQQCLPAEWSSNGVWAERLSSGVSPTPPVHWQWHHDCLVCVVICTATSLIKVMKFSSPCRYSNPDFPLFCFCVYVCVPGYIFLISVLESLDYFLSVPQFIFLVSVCFTNLCKCRTRKNMPSCWKFIIE